MSGQVECNETLRLEGLRTLAQMIARARLTDCGREPDKSGKSGGEPEKDGDSS